jgi:CheY-like chemotaxis protein
VANTGSILLAEDNPDDVLLIRRAFKRAGFGNAIQVVSDGEKAIRYLKGEEPYGDRSRFPIPHLLLLDLKMPGLNGFDVLSWIRQRAEWKCLPIIVLTTSFYGPDIDRAYELGANSFLTKPAHFDEFVVAIKQMGDFWLGHTILPLPGPFVPAPRSAPGNAPKPPPGALRESAPRPTRISTARKRPAAKKKTAP